MAFVLTTVGVLATSACFVKPDRPLDDGDGSISGVEPNLAFVTSVPRPVTAITSLDYADQWCMEAAAAATPALRGNYKAWLSSSVEPAQNRFGAARGWVRTDGKPFAASIDELVTSRRMFYPLRFDENGNDIVTTNPITDDSVATGTDKFGNFSSNCFDFTGGGTMTRGFADAGGESWTAADGATTCSSVDMVRIYCLGTDRTSAVNAPSASGPRVFLSEIPIDVGPGVQAFDNRCAQDAAAATPPLTGEFRAVVATTALSALERVGALGQTWVRVDGVAVTADFEQVQAPLNVSAKAHYIDSGYAWNGAATASEPGTSTCADWTDNVTGFAHVGDSVHSDPSAFARAALMIGCGLSIVHVYCAEVQH